MLARHVRILEEDRALAATLQHAVGNLRIAAHRAALVARHPRRIGGPAAAPRQLVEALAGGAGGHALAEAGQHVEMLVGEGQHRRLHRIVGDQRQGLSFERMQVVSTGIGGQSGVDAFDLDPVARGGDSRNERLAMDHALTLERGRLGKHRRRVDRIDQVDRAIEGALRSHADHFGHQLHQAALAAVGIAMQARIAGQEAIALDRVVGTADCMQGHAQLAQARLTGTQPAEQRGTRVMVVQAVGGQADAHRGRPQWWKRQCMSLSVSLERFAIFLIAVTGRVASVAGGRCFVQPAA